MAIYTIRFDKEPDDPRGPTYESYMVGVNSICFDDVRYHPVVFNNNITGDFVVGWNWVNANGNPPQTLRILSFTDKTETIEISTGLVIPNNYPPNTLRDNSTGLDLTYPYEFDINSLGNIRENSNQLEISCEGSGSDKYKNTRQRIIEYIILDSGGIPGPTRTATFQNIAP